MLLILLKSSFYFPKDGLKLCLLFFSYQSENTVAQVLRNFIGTLYILQLWKQLELRDSDLRWDYFC